MSFRVVKSIRINDSVEFMDIDITQSDVGVGSVTTSAAFQILAAGYVMGNGGGSAGQVVRLTTVANIVTIAGVDSPSSAENIVGMLTADATSGLSATIIEMGRLDGVYTALNLGRKYLGTAGLVVDSPPLNSALSIRQPLGFSPVSGSIQFRIGEMKIN